MAAQRDHLAVSSDLIVAGQVIHVVAGQVIHAPGLLIRVTTTERPYLTRRMFALEERSGLPIRTLVLDALVRGRGYTGAARLLGVDASLVEVWCRRVGLDVMVRRGRYARIGRGAQEVMGGD